MLATNHVSKKIPEVWAMIYWGILMSGSAWLALHQQLSPWLFFILLIGDLLVVPFTRFNEQDPSPWLHFNRPIESLLLFGFPLAGIFYYFTWISESITPLALIRAQVMVLYCYYLLILIGLAAIPILGIYFAVRILFFWAGQFIAQTIPINYPIITSIAIVICFMMGLGVWFTSSMFFYGILMKHEPMGSQTQYYTRVAKIFLVLTLVIGICAIIFENTWLPWLIQFLTPIIV